MRRRLVRKFGSLIGLLAILMSVLAPAVSQALASGAHAETILSAYCSAASQSQAEKHTPSQHSAAGHGDACGYCNFAAHSPAAPPSTHALQPRLAATCPGDRACLIASLTCFSTTSARRERLMCESPYRLRNLSFLVRLNLSYKVNWFGCLICCLSCTTRRIRSFLIRAFRLAR